METALIIPSHKQVKYWIKMVAGIEKQSVLPKYVYLMLDRESEKDYKYVESICSSKQLKNKYKVYNLHEIPEYLGRPNNLPDQNLFLTGRNRNLAIEDAIKDGCESFVMIDGDCIPEEDLIKTHQEIHSLGIPTISCGKRKEAKYKWKDQRDVDSRLHALDLFNSGNGFIIQNYDLLLFCSIVWSCNVGMNLQAIKLIKKLNEKYYGRKEVFNSEFLGTWGGEDSFLGIQAHMCRIFICIINEEKSGIKHMEHLRPSSKYGDQAFSEYLKQHIELLNEMQINSPLTMDFFKTD